MRWGTACRGAGSCLHGRSWRGGSSRLDSPQAREPLKGLEQRKAGRWPVWRLAWGGPEFPTRAKRRRFNTIAATDFCSPAAAAGIHRARVPAGPGWGHLGVWGCGRRTDLPWVVPVADLEALLDLTWPGRASLLRDERGEGRAGKGSVIKLEG